MSTGCTQIGVQLANVPVALSDIQRYEDIAYGGLPEQRLDIYVPSLDEGRERFPVVVFFYGGRWTEGDKSMYPFVAQQFVEQGFVVVIPDYRKYPGVRFPAFVEDGAQAVAWTVRNIDKYLGDADQLFIAGHSAGAHIGALLTVDETYLKKFDLSNQRISAFAGLAGPYDFVPDAQDLKDIFGPPERYPEMVVTNFVDGNEAPILLLWGEEDSLVGKRNLERLSREIRLAGGQVTTKIYPNMGHVDMISSMTWFLPEKAPVVEDTVKFFKQHNAGI